MNRNSTLKIILTALFAALTCVTTLCIRVPSPTNGYVNLGDAIVLLSAFLLGPLYGTAAAGIGSMLADVFAGFPAYAPGTLIIKALVALAASCVYRMLHREDQTARQFISRIIIAGICGEIFMVLGYFVYSGIALSYGLGAAAEIPGNCVQAAFGIAIASVLTPALLKSPEIRKQLSAFDR